MIVTLKEAEAQRLCFFFYGILRLCVAGADIICFDYEA